MVLVLLVELLLQASAKAEHRETAKSAFIVRFAACRSIMESRHRQRQRFAARVRHATGSKRPCQRNGTRFRARAREPLRTSRAGR